MCPCCLWLAKGGGVLERGSGGPHSMENTSVGSPSHLLKGKLEGSPKKGLEGKETYLACVDQSDFRIRENLSWERRSREFVKILKAGEKMGKPEGPWQTGSLGGSTCLRGTRYRRSTHQWSHRSLQRPHLRAQDSYLCISHPSEWKAVRS